MRTTEVVLLQLGLPGGERAAPTNSLLVTFELVPSGADTVIRFTETGFRERGWKAAVLKERHKGAQHGLGQLPFPPRRVPHATGSHATSDARNNDHEQVREKTNKEKETEMVDILHRVGIKSASLDDVYDALTTVESLSDWWTTNTKGDGQVGGVLQFRFGAGGFDMEVLELQPAKHVLWRVVDGPAEWIGTTVRWDLKQEDDHTVVLFAHRGWREPVEFMHHCSTKWAIFLMSLKALLETGKGSPDPHDVKIDNWN